MLNLFMATNRTTAERDALDAWPVVDEQSRVVIVDLSQASELMTVDFARLLMLRRGLLGQGRDLHLTGLSGRARSFYDISRLQAALPVVSTAHFDAPGTVQMHAAPAR